jgi:hypothetical protein
MIQMPCLLCDKPADVDPEELEGMEAPAAFCDECLHNVDHGFISWPLVKMTYMMRCQIGALGVRVQKLEAR